MAIEYKAPALIRRMNIALHVETDGSTKNYAGTYRLAVEDTDGGRVRSAGDRGNIIPLLTNTGRQQLLDIVNRLYGVAATAFNTSPLP